jgi:quinol monooxygenase YgiN
MARITVIGVARCAPGHQEDIARGATEQLRRSGAAVQGRIDAHLFEDEDDPQLLAYVGRWESRAAFESYFQHYGQFGVPAWYAEPPRVWRCEPLKTYVQIYARSEVASLILIDGPAETAGQRRDLVLAYGRTFDPAAIGIVEYEVAADVDDPGRLVIFARWHSAKAAAVRPVRHRDFIPPLQALGATVRRLVGPQRAETPWETPS